MSGMKLSSQVELVRENLVFDPSEYYSLFEGFEPWIFAVQNYNSHMLCGSVLMTSMNFFIPCGKVLGSNIGELINQGLYADEKFFASKWPDLRTNHFKEGGDDKATPRERPWTNSLSMHYNLLQADQLDPSLLRLIQLKF
ncbi:hypothetical protein J1N35_018446 [Gossypium stocksii]|uniref:Uncharacterized protein n=1 Tax=Gossypium stocksii TaxID=47602 RepID=A0A9D3VPW2_9ROSI|nr:hypothetical protein J1N35_018446 [Gossypium stocksii]